MEKEEGNAKSAEVTALDVISRARYVTEELFKVGRMKKVELLQESENIQITKLQNRVLTNDQYMRIVRLADLRPSATTWLNIVKYSCKTNTDLIITHGTAAALQNYIDREHGRE